MTTTPASLTAPSTPQLPPPRLLQRLLLYPATGGSPQTLLCATVQDLVRNDAGGCVGVAIVRICLRTPTAYPATAATTRSHITTTTAPSQHNSVLRAVSPIPRTNKQMRSHGTGARRPQLPEPGHTNTAVAGCVSRFCDQL